MCIALTFDAKMSKRLRAGKTGSQRKKAKFEELQRHARESRWNAWSFDDKDDAREFVIFVQSPMPSDSSLKSGLFKVAEEMWLEISILDVTSSCNAVFAKFAGKTEQLVRLRTTLLQDGTGVTFQLACKRALP